MKTTIREIASLVLFVAAPLGFAQRGGIGQIGYPHGRSSDPTLNATADQRTAVTRCLEATELVRHTADQMPRIGGPWSRSRLNYSASDLNALSELTERFETLLADLAATHQEFTEKLTKAQRDRLEQQLRKLEQLQAKMNSASGELDRDLARAKPGPTSPNIAWDVVSIKSAADKWRSENRRIAKEMGVLQ